MKWRQNCDLNLLKNTLRHNPEPTQVEITILKKVDGHNLICDDFGQKFGGDTTKLGSLFTNLIRLKVLESVSI